MKKVIVLCLVLVMVLATGCAGEQVRLGKGSDGKSIKVAPGQILVISLAGNPSTGYNWQVLGELPAMFEQLGEPEFKTSIWSLGRVGAGGTVTLRFKVLTAGTADLELGYVRSWEDAAPGQTFSIAVDAV